MPEYIDKEAICKKSIRLFGTEYVSIMAIEAECAADVAPVRHGKWVKAVNDNGNLVHKCSLCDGYVPCDFDGYEVLSYYCPACGAKMDEEEVIDNV